MPGLIHRSKVWTQLLNLRSSKWPERVKAAQQLGELKDPRAVEPLAELLAGQTPKLFGGFLSGEVSGSAISPGIYGRDDCNRPLVREAAAKALGQIGDRRGVPSLCAAAIHDPEPSVQTEAARALGLIGDARAAESVAPLLRSSLADVRETAVLALARLGAPAIPWLIGLLKHSTFEARQAAARALGIIGDPQVIPPLLAALADPDFTVRCEVIEALASAARSAAPPLLERLKDTKPEVRLAAAKTIGKIRDPAAIIALIEATHDPSPEVRDAAWHSLKLLNWQPGLAREQARRALAAGDLNKVVAAGGAAVEPLLEIYRGSDKATREQIEEALRRIGPAAIPPLFAALLDLDRDVRHFAARQLTAFGWQPTDAAQRIRLAIALGRYSVARAEGAPAFEPLIAVLKHSSDWDQSQAALVLGELGDVQAAGLDDHLDRGRAAAGNRP